MWSHARIVFQIEFSKNHLSFLAFKIGEQTEIRLHSPTGYILNIIIEALGKPTCKNKLLKNLITIQNHYWSIINESIIFDLNTFGNESMDA